METMRRLIFSMVYVRGLATGADCAEFRDVLAMSRKVLLVYGYLDSFGFQLLLFRSTYIRIQSTDTVQNILWLVRALRFPVA